MTYNEEKRLKEEKRRIIANMSDTDKLNYIVNLLNKDVDMFTDYSDLDGVDFTTEYYENENKIEEFLEIVNNK